MNGQMEVNILVFLIEKNEDSKDAIIKRQKHGYYLGFLAVSNKLFVCKGCISSLTTPHALNLTN